MDPKQTQVIELEQTLQVTLRLMEVVWDIDLREELKQQAAAIHAELKTLRIVRVPLPLADSKAFGSEDSSSESLAG